MIKLPTDLAAKVLEWRDRIYPRISAASASFDSGDEAKLLECSLSSAEREEIEELIAPYFKAEKLKREDYILDAKLGILFRQDEKLAGIIVTERAKYG